MTTASGQSAPLMVTADNAAEVAKVAAALLRPFAEGEIKLKPARVNGGRCLALAYVDARAVMERLDEVLGIDGWADQYTVLPTGEVECRLALRLGGRWVTKADVGGQSEQPDEGDRMKAAYSDALKRAAVKFGVGRHLYRRPQEWMDYDPARKCVVRPGAASESAREIAAAFDAAASREQGSAPWKRYDAALKAGRVSAADKAHVEAALRRFGERFPKPKAAGTNPK